MSKSITLAEALADPPNARWVRVTSDDDPAPLWPRLPEMTQLDRLELRGGLRAPIEVVVPPSLRALDVVVASPHDEVDAVVATFPHIRRLEVWGRHLKDQQLPASIANLRELASLELVSCGVSDLPDELAALPLVELAIHGCPLKTFPLVIGKLRGLRKLVLHAELGGLPDELGELSELVELDLKGSLNKGVTGAYSKFTKALPLAIGKLTNLEVLNLEQCGVNDDLSPLAGLTKLRVLDISWGIIKDLSGLAPLNNLEELAMSKCYKVASLSPLAMLPKLAKLDMSSCHDVEDLSALAELKALRELDIDSCHSIGSLAPIFEHPTLEKLSAASAIEAKWQQRQRVRRLPPRADLERQLASDDFAVFANALELLAAFIELNSTREASALASYFELDEDPNDEEIVAIPVLDAAFARWANELAPAQLVAIARMGLVSITENYAVSLAAIERIAALGDVEAQTEIARAFHAASQYYDAGHRFMSHTVLDQLIDSVFARFRPAALAALLEPCGTDALSSEGGGDQMDALFVAALAQTGELDENTAEKLVAKFREYAEAMIGHGHADVIERLRGEIRAANAAAGATIDEFLRSAEDQIALQREIEALETPAQVVAVLERVLAGELELAALAEISEFSTRVERHADEIPPELAIATLRAAWELGISGWMWDRLVARRFVTDAAGTAALVRVRVADHPDEMKKLVDQIKRGKRYLLKDRIGAPDATTTAMRALHSELEGIDGAAALAAELGDLVLAFGQDHGDEAVRALIVTMKRFADTDAQIKPSWDHFMRVQMQFETLVRTGAARSEAWPAVAEFLAAFACTLGKIAWDKNALETIAADAVASAQLSKREDILAIAFDRLITLPVEKDRLAFNLACYYASLADKPNVLTWTRRALELGKAAAQFRADSDFARFQSDPEFLAVLATER